MSALRILDISPARILIFSFLFVILAGTFLLYLPISRVVDMHLIDLFFTATTSTCVTGLFTVPMSYFSFFGQCVILVLIQIGGLGLMTLSIFLVSLVLNLSLTTKFLAGQILDFAFSGKLKTFLKTIIGFTIFTEGVGALILYKSFIKILPRDKAIFYSIFHSVSAFCNSGASLFEPGISNLAKDSLSLLTMAVLIFLGGIGFIVWYEAVSNLVNYIKNWWNEEPKKLTMSLHTKIVLITSSTLIFLGALLFFVLERTNTLSGLSTWHQIVNSIFISVTARTAGFENVDMSSLGLPILLILIILMFIGASSSSTGGGVKVTTFTVFVATIAATIRNKNNVEIFGRTISPEQIFKTTAIIALSLSFVLATTFILLITDPEFSFMQILFETVSAFATVGLSTGITPYFSIFGKIVLMLAMFLGRVGALTLVLALRKNQEPQLYKYPEERVLLG